MSIFRLLGVVLKNARHIWLVFSVSRILDHLAVLKLIIYLDKLGVLEFMREPRSIDDVSIFLGGVRRLDLLEDIFSTLREAGVFIGENGRFSVDWRKVEKFRAMREKNPTIRIFEVLLKGIENMLMVPPSRFSGGLTSASSRRKLRLYYTFRGSILSSTLRAVFP